MAFVAKIPKEIIFKLSLSKNDSSQFTNTNWYDLPESHPEQKDVKKFQVRTTVAHPFVVTTKRELKKYENDSKYYVHDNKPMNIRLAGYMNVGTKADSKFEAQVLLPTGHSVSIPHDVLINSLLIDGIGSNGMLNGEYVFAIVNRRIKLIRVETGIHKAIQKHIKKRSHKPMSIKDMTVGKVYKTAAGNVGLFLGFVTTETMVVDVPDGIKRYWNSQNDPNLALKPVDPFTVRFLRQELASLWYPVRVFKWLGKQITEDELYQRFIFNFENKPWVNIKVNKSHSYVEEVPGYHLDLPFDVVTHIRNCVSRKAQETIERHRIIRTNRHVSPRKNNWHEAYNAPDHLRHYDAISIQDYAGLSNMSLFGTGFIRSEPFKLFEPWEKK